MKSRSIPDVLPIFPLTGSLLLPGNFLPLNVFEPRYRNLVRDAMEGERFIGMIQPRVPLPDGGGPVSGHANPEVYGVGCAGFIEECETQPDGRFLIVLKGVARYRVREELQPKNGYRRIVADWSEFAQDLEPSDETLNPARVLAAAAGFGERHGLKFDADLLASLPAVALVNGLAAALPFPAGEKQALLEAPETAGRERILLELMGMGIELPAREAVWEPPIIN